MYERKIIQIIYILIFFYIVIVIVICYIFTNADNLPPKVPKDTLPMYSYSSNDSNISNIQSSKSGLSGNILPPPATTHSSGASNVPNMFPLSVISSFLLFALP